MLRSRPWRLTFLMLFLVALLLRCQSPAPKNLPRATAVADTRRPESSPTSMPPTATQLPTETPAPSPTATTAPTATPIPTPTPRPSFSTAAGFNFSQQGLGLKAGGGNAWDSFQVFMPDVFYHEGQFHMFYVGYSNSLGNNGAIGYATSTDGINFSKHADNPVLTGTAEFPNLVAPELFFDGQQWVLYVNGGKNGGAIGDAILRATAPDLTGPWTLSPEPVLSARGLRPWDRKSQPSTVLTTDEGMIMYYMGIGGLGIQMGLARSPDGIQWTRYDDPDTADRFAGSDPILAVGLANSWDSAAAGTLEVIRNTAVGRWEMFFTGSMTDPFAITRESILTKKPVGIGFATSDDGVKWTTHAHNPVITLLENCWPLLGTVLVDETYYIYHDQNCGFEGISVISGTIAE